MRALFVTNPTSGHIRRNPGIFSKIDRFVLSHLPGAQSVSTTHRGHASELAAQAAASGFDLVVAVGGDGTVNELASGLLGTGTRLGIIPLGSGNGLARELRIPLSTDAALANLVTGRPVLIDAGISNGKPFFCTSGTGFDAHVVHRFNSRVNRGFFAYVEEGLRAWRSYQPCHYSIQVDQKVLPSGPALFLTVANASQFGNNARIAPQARPNDGLLDLVIVRPHSLPRALQTCLRLFTGRLRPDARFEYHRGSQFCIKTDRTGFFHVDGEVHTLDAPWNVSVRAASIEVLCPAA